MTARYIVSDVFDGLATLETGSVDLVVTSPPFLALRSYLPADHPDKDREIGSEATPAEFIDVMLRVTQELRRVLAPHGSICIELGDTYAGSGGAGGDYAPNGWREGQEAFEGSGKLAQYNDARGNPDGMRDPTFSGANTLTGSGAGWPLAKSKALIAELYRVALAYGINPLTGTESPAGRWRIRNVVTWVRPNPPVGALGDKWRPATSDLVVACTSGKRYWDDLATRKPWSATTGGMGASRGHYYDDLDRMWQTGNGQGRGVKQDTQGGAPLLDWWEIPLLEGEEPKAYGPKPPKPKGMSRHREGEPPRTDLPSQQRDGNWRTLPQTNDDPNGPGAPLLDWWEIPPGGYKGSHYAVFPEELVVPCVQAMCPPKVCRTCGEPSRRITKPSEEYAARLRRVADAAAPLTNGSNQTNPNRLIRGKGHFTNTDEAKADQMAGKRAQKITLGFTDCGHDDWRPGLILDPFAGSGTTLAVATGYGHDAIGIDLDPRNAELALDRVGPFLLEVAQ